MSSCYMSWVWIARWFGSLALCSGFKILAFLGTNSLFRDRPRRTEISRLAGRDEKQSSVN
jgi:hypothetical protein